MQYVQLTAAEQQVGATLRLNDGRPTFTLAGPLVERQLVETPWGEAWAEEGCYIAEDIEGNLHIVAQQDFLHLYRSF